MRKGSNPPPPVGPKPAPRFVNGRKVYGEDYIYDPLSKQGFD